jgi:DNA-binding IscR family transcriptional regulator
LLDIIEATEGPIAPDECVLKGGPCHWDEVCAIHWVWSSSKDAFSAELRKATLAQIVQDDLALKKGTKEIPENLHRGE